ncbi:glycosyltransferase, partial [Patescibacteria group bacterium]|nr:glycosyltransferase [Patescibacteria group bacterium]
MKIALVHDYIKEYGGAERVLEVLHEIWPKAPIYTSIFLPKFAGPNRSKVEKWKVKTSFLQYLPFKGKLLSPFRLIAPFLFKTFDLSNYDVIIVSATGTYTSPNFVKTGKKTLHVCYCHTPPRYLYGYPVANPWGEVLWRRVLKFFGQVPMHFLRIFDFKSAQIPDYLIANSQEVAARIEKFYRRKAKVIYPPVDIPKLSKRSKVKGQRSYYLTGGRLARHKGQELAIKACTKMNLPL